MECRESDIGDLGVYLPLDDLFLLGHENFVKGLDVAAVLFECISNAVSKGAVLMVELQPVYDQV